VATNVQGISDLVKKGRNGYLFSPGDDRALGKHLISIIGDAEGRSRMGKESLKIVQKYDWANIAEQYLRIYER